MKFYSLLVALLVSASVQAQTLDSPPASAQLKAPKGFLVAIPKDGSPEKAMVIPFNGVQEKITDAADISLNKDKIGSAVEKFLTDNKITGSKTEQLLKSKSLQLASQDAKDLKGQEAWVHCHYYPHYYYPYYNPWFYSYGPYYYGSWYMPVYYTPAYNYYYYYNQGYCPSYGCYQPQPSYPQPQPQPGYQPGNPQGGQNQGQGDGTDSTATEQPQN